MSEAIGPWQDDATHAHNGGICERRNAEGDELRAWVYTDANVTTGYVWCAWRTAALDPFDEGTVATVAEARAAADAALGLRPAAQPPLRADLLETLALTVRVGDPVATMTAVQVLADWCEEQGARGVWRVSQEWVAGRWRSTVYRDGVCVAGGGT